MSTSVTIKYVLIVLSAKLVANHDFLITTEDHPSLYTDLEECFSLRSEFVNLVK